MFCPKSRFQQDDLSRSFPLSPLWAIYDVPGGELVPVFDAPDLYGHVSAVHTGSLCRIKSFHKEVDIMTDPSRLDKTFQLIMNRMVETGQAPHYTELAADLGVPPEEGRKALHDLFSSGIPGWVYPNTDYIVSFAPFNNLPTQYRITIDGQQKWFAQ
jgi:hypothetical protein